MRKHAIRNLTAEDLILNNTHSQRLRPTEVPADSKASALAPTPQPQPSPTFLAQVKASPSLAAVPPKVNRLPYTLMKLEPPQPVSVINANPVFGTKDAATIVGVSEDCLRKWRLRDQGPNYLQYGGDGAVRYFLSDLIAFRARHKVTPSKALKGWSK